LQLFFILWTWSKHPKQGDAKEDCVHQEDQLGGLIDLTERSARWNHGAGCRFK